MPFDITKLGSDDEDADDSLESLLNVYFRCPYCNGEQVADTERVPYEHTCSLCFNKIDVVE